MSQHVSMTDSKGLESQGNMEQMDGDQSRSSGVHIVHESSESMSERERRKKERDRKREEQEQRKVELLKLKEEEERRAIELQNAIIASEKEIEALDQSTESDEGTSRKSNEGHNECHNDSNETESEHSCRDDNIASAQGERVHETTQREGISLVARVAFEEEDENVSIDTSVEKTEHHRVERASEARAIEARAIEARKRIYDLEIEKRRISLATQKALEEIDVEMTKVVYTAGSGMTEKERKELGAHIRSEEYIIERKEGFGRKKNAEVVLRHQAEIDRATELKKEKDLEFEERCRYLEGQRRKLREEEKAFEAYKKLQIEELQEKEENIEVQRKQLLRPKKDKDPALQRKVDLGPPVDSSTDIDEEKEEEKDFKRRMSWLDEKYEKLPAEEKVVIENKPQRTLLKSKLARKVKEEQPSVLDEANGVLRLHSRPKLKVKDSMDDTEDEIERRLLEKVERLKKKDEDLAGRISKVKAQKERDEQRTKEKKLKEERIRKLKAMEQSLTESLREKESELSELETSTDEKKSSKEEKKEKKPSKEVKHSKDSSRENEKKMGISFKRPTIPKLTEETFEEWKQEVEVILKSGLYHKDIIRQEVRNSLSGSTRKILLNMDPEASTQELITKLENIYGNIRTGESVLAEFYNAQQSDTETSAEWGVRIESILKSAIKKGQVQQNKADEMLRNRFWRHLRSFHLKNATRVFYETEKDFEELKRKVRLEENEMKTAREKDKREKQGEKQVTSNQRTDNNEQTSMMKSILDRMEKIEKEIMKQSESNDQRKSDSERQEQSVPERYRRDESTSDRYRRDDSTSDRYRRDESNRGDYSKRGRSWNRGNYNRGYGYRRGYRGNYNPHPSRNSQSREYDRRDESHNDRREPRDTGSRGDTQDYRDRSDTHDQKRGN